MIESSAEGIGQSGRAAARRFARQVTAAELAATVRSPLHRPVGIICLVGSVVLGLFTGLMVKSVLAAMVGGVVAAGYLIGCVAAISLLSEARAYRRAARRWWISIGSAVGAAVAFDDGRGGWVLKSVSARPANRGAGQAVMARVCQEADQEGRDITIDAVNDRVAGFYKRFGFVRQRRVLPYGQQRMIRTGRPNPADWRR